MKIRSIMCPMNDQAHANLFDAAVNESLAEGWQLTKREVLPGGPLAEGVYLHRTLYAELVLPDPPAEPAEPDLFACAEAIRKECTKNEHCNQCQLDEVCECTPPHEWRAAPGND